MRRALTGLLAAALFVPGMVAADGTPTVDDRSHELRSADPLPFVPAGMTEDRFPAATSAESVYVTSHDGFSLHARVFRPDTSSDPDHRLPIILTHSPYYAGSILGGNERSLDLVEFFTPKGYAVVLTDVRGTGNSGGCAEQDGVNQAEDFKTLVEHFAAQEWSNGKVGSYGKSYDAETQNAGIVLAPEGLATAVTVAGISGLYDVAFYDAVPLGVNGPLSAAIYVPYGVPSGAPGDPFAVKTFECQAGNFAGPANVTGDQTQYWRDREFRLKVTEIPEPVSVLHVHGLHDGIVTPIAIDGWYDRIPGFTRAIWGQWAHHYPYDAPAVVARDDWYDTIHAWFDFFLLDLPTGVASWPPVQVQAEDGVWRGVNSFEEMGRTVRLPLGSELLDDSAAEGTTVAIFEDETAMWTSAPFEGGVHLSGRAVLDAVITLDLPDAHFAIALDEVSASGQTRQLTEGWLSAMHRDGLAQGAPVPIGEEIRYRIRTYPFDAYLSEGSSLRLRLTGDLSPGLPAETNWTGTILVDGTSQLAIQVEDAPCGLEIATTEEPLGFAPGCPDGIPIRPDLG